MQTPEKQKHANTEKSFWVRVNRWKEEEETAGIAAITQDAFLNLPYCFTKVSRDAFLTLFFT